MNVRPLGPRLALPPTNPESPTQCYLDPLKPDKADPESTLSSTSHLSPLRSPQSSVSQTGSYMKMKMDHHPRVNKERDIDCRRPSVVTGDHCSVAACGMDGWEPGEAKERLGYMMMSPQLSHSSSVLPPDDYVTMASPHKHDWPAYSSPSSSLQTSFNR